MEQKVKIMDVYFQSAENYNIKVVKEDKKEYIVLPVVMMVEGVHHGSHGPILHLTEELSKSVSQWENKPVTIQHPEFEGEYVSAEVAEVAEYKVGFVRNAKMDNEKLKAEVWVDKQRLIAISPETLQQISNNEIIEVSVGIFADDELSEGIWGKDNEEYKIIARNHRPDHLALLPGEIGACSIHDGCGIRVNKKGGKNVNVKEQIEKLLKFNHFTINKDGYQETVEKMWNHFSAMESDTKSFYLVDVYDDYVIYRMRNKVDDKVVMFQQNYTVMEDGSIELTGDAQKVRRDVTYVTVNKKKPRKRIINKKEKNMCGKCEEKAEALIAHEATRFTDDDFDWLTGLTEDKLDKLIPMRHRAKKPENHEVTVEEAWEVIQSNNLKLEDYLEKLPEGLKVQVTSGLTAIKEQKDTLVTNILENTEEGTWEKETLEGMDIDVLKRLEKTALKEAGDFTVNGTRNNLNNNKSKDISPMPAAGVDFETKN